MAGTSENGGDDGNKGWIIVGTDNRLYGYTSSTLHILLLSLFVKLHYRLPNLVVGSITRESIRTALINGITAQQILDFLEINAHPQMKMGGAEGLFASTGATSSIAGKPSFIVLLLYV